MPDPDRDHRRQATRKVRPASREQARELRHPLTPAEQKLWAKVRGRQLGGWKVRRQQPIGRFIADFYCPEARLVIEVDGDSHAAPDQAAYDAARTEWLLGQGYHVIRFDNRQVHEQLAAVLSELEAACGRYARKAGGG